MATKNALSHQKLQKVINKRSVYFNKKSTYIVSYVFTGASDRGRILSSFRDAHKQLIERFPDNEDLKNCIFDINVPQRYNAETNMYTSMDFVYVYISNWAVGKAICGFNFNGSMMQTIELCPDQEIDLEKEVEKRFSMCDDIPDEVYKERTKSYKTVLNKITNAKRESIILRLSDVFEHACLLQACIRDIVIASIGDGFGCNDIVYVIANLIEAEVTIEEEKRDNMENYHSYDDEWSVSLFHAFLLAEIDDRVHKFVKNTNMNQDTMTKLLNLMKFISTLYVNGIIGTEDYFGFFQTIVKAFEMSDSMDEKIIGKLIMMYRVASSRIINDCPKIVEMLEEFIDDFGDSSSRTMFDTYSREASEKKWTSVKQYGSRFKFTKIESHCFLPAVKLSANQEKQVRDYSSKRGYQCSNLEWCGIRANESYVETCATNLRPNKLISKSVPSWVSDEDVKNRLRRFSTSEEKGKWPVVNVRTHDDGWKTYYATFSPSNNDYQDAPFAALMLCKIPIYNNTNKEYCHLSFFHETIRTNE